MTDIRLPNSCGRCGTRWSGDSTSHCGSCHETMAGPSVFDRHRREGRCLDPVALGCVLRVRPGYTVWGFPADEADRERLQALRGAA